MKKIVVIVLIIVVMYSCKSTKSSTVGTVDQKAEHGKELNKTDIDISKKVELHENNGVQIKEPMRITTMDKSQIRKISVEKSNKLGDN